MLRFNFGPRADEAPAEAPEEEAAPETPAEPASEE